MTIQIVSKLRRFISMAAVVAIIFLFLNCKKSSGGSGANTTWYFNLSIGDSVMTNVGGTGLDGLVNTSGNIANSFVGGPTMGYQNNYPGIVIQIAGSCNTSATNPCLTFIAYLSKLELGTYIMTDTTTSTYAFGAFGVDELRVAINQPLTGTGYYTYFSGNTNPITSLSLSIDTLTGQNISGHFGGNILKINNISLSFEDSVSISGSFNVYRAS